VPAYVVFTDATLETVATTAPADTRSLVAIPGIGARKLDAYGAVLLALVRGEDPAVPADTA
jgi:DNA helicase-2/ATP-dependent DNA helicase PcrA